jgi:hypothetical protein
MRDFVRSRGIRGRALTLLVGVFTIVALAIAGPVTATPAGGPAENFHPNDEFGANPTPLSDRPDGSTSSNATAHVTTVAVAATAAVEYFICPAAYGDGAAAGDPTQPATGCNSVGLDTAPTTPTTTGGLPAGVDEAYEAEINVSIDGVRDFVAWVCTSATLRNDANCEEEEENNITLDDASTGANPGDQSSAGEIMTPTHGASVSNAGFVAIVRTSPDVSSVIFCLDGTAADATMTAVGCGTPIPDSTPNNADTSVYKEWSASFTGGNAPPPNAEMGLYIGDASGGQGTCASDATICLLDSHYLVSTAAVPTKAVVHFPNGGTPAGSSVCVDNPATPAVTEGPDTAETNPPNVVETVQGCLLDQSNNVINNGAGFETAFQVTPADPAATTGDTSGFFDPAQDGDENDTNADFTFEQVDLDPAGANDATGGPSATAADQRVRFKRTGAYTITFCLDANNDAEDTPPVTTPPTVRSATPCAGETVTGSATKTIAVTPASAAAHSHLLRSSDVQANSSCHVGPSAFSAPAGTNVNLTGCLKDQYENPVPGARTIWTAVVLGTAFFVGTPESLSDANGQADAVIGSPASAEGKNTTIQFCQDENANGACDGGSASELNVAWGPPTAGGGGGGPSHACEKARARVKQAKHDLQEAIQGGDKGKIERARHRLRSAKRHRRRACRR